MWRQGYRATCATCDLTWEVLGYASNAQAQVQCPTCGRRCWVFREFWPVAKWAAVSLLRVVRVEVSA